MSSSDLFTAVLNPNPMLFWSNVNLVESTTQAPAFPASFNGVDYSHPHQVMKFGMGEACGESSNANGMVDYMLNPQEQEQEQEGCGYYGTRTISSCCSFDKLSFADVMQLADLGPKLGLNQSKIEEDQEAAGGMDPVLFLKFPVLNDKSLGEDHDDHSNNLMLTAAAATGGREDGGEEAVGASHKSNNNKIKSVQLGMVGGEEEDMEISKGVQDDENNNNNINNNNNMNNKSKRKRSRTIKTSEEVESQRMTHIAVERNRRKQMNEHLRVLRSLMPGSYVQRGDQASIIGGAIEFVRELEQLLQCLESQKRRRLLGVGEAAAHTRQVVGDASLLAIQAQAQAQQHQQQQPPMFLALPNHEEFEAAAAAAGLREETAENKSCLADVEVKLLGFDAMIKILSRRRPGQLIKTIAALEDLHLIILHTNITTIEQTVLYSFNVKVASDSRFTAQDIATSVQQIFSFIHDNTGM